MDPEYVPLLSKEKYEVSSSLEKQQIIEARPHRRNRWIGISPVFALCLFLLWSMALDLSDEQDDASICLTPECVLASAELLQSRSPNYANIDPCDDFRSYMCEGFDATHDLRSDQSDLGSLSVLAERGQALLRHILETPVSKVTFGETSTVDEDNFVKVRDAYGACLNESAIGYEDVSPLHELLEGIWASTSTTKIKSLADANAYLMSIGVQPFLELDIRADERDPDVNVLYASAPGSFGLPTKEYYEDKDILERYTKMAQEVSAAVGKDSDADKALISSIIDLEIKLAAASPSEEDRENVQKYYNPRSLHNVTSTVSQLDVPSLLKSLNADFEPKKVILGSQSYTDSLAEIFEETDLVTLKAYMSWKVVQRFAFAVEGDAVSPIKRFNNVLSGKAPDAKPERWRTCLRHVDGGLGWILSRFFVEKAFSEEAKNYGDQIILDIKSEFALKLDASDWMTKDVRKVAIDKVHNIVQKIGFPTASPDIRNSTELADYYKLVDVSSDKYFDNVLSMVRSDVIRMWETATKPVDRNEWGMTASTVNAYYNPAGNEIVFPAGIMQRAIFYPPELPAYLSYGAFGAVAGHELSHAFDSTGRHFDQNGNYTEWWDDSTITAFKSKAECFVQQYTNYTINGPDNQPHHVNGRLTLGENLADAGGLSAAFNAWKRREEENPGELLPGLQEYTKEQVFFMSYGNVWCGKTRAAEMLRRLYSDPHSPSAARVLLTVANSGEFRESFNCKVKEPTCKLW